MTGIKQFFENNFGNEQIWFRCIGKGKPIDVHGRYNENTIKVLEQANQQNYEVYFGVNSGGYKDSEITKINAVFIDLDCGRDKEGQYYPLENVGKYKKEKLKELDRFNLPPNNVIETRNGLHVYWLLHPGATIDEFKEAESRLIEYFNADRQVRNPARLMRVPGYYWCKDKENRFLSKIIAHKNVRYSIKELINILPEVMGRVRGVHDKANNTIKSLLRTPKPSPNLKYIAQKDVGMLQSTICPEPMEFNSHKEVYDHLKKQDLALFLGIDSKNFCCIFHDDKNPSANIYVDPKTSFYWYKCFSESCGVTKDIISITENLLNCTTPHALQFLRKVYKIGFVETAWQKEQRQLLEENKRLLYDSERLIILAPDLYKLIKNYLVDLIIINDFAQKHVYTSNFTDNTGHALFFASLGHLAKICNHHHSRRLQDRIALFTYLGLLHKLTKAQIPDFLLTEAIHQAKTKNQKNIVNFYSIPSYCDSTLSFSTKKANTYQKSGYTMKGWGRELILRAEGESEADRVYPQMKGQPLPSLNEKIATEMEETALDLIEQKGWTAEKEIIGNVHMNFKGNSQFKEKHIKHYC